MIATALVSAACAQPIDGTKLPASVASGVSLEQIEDLIGAAACRSDAECRVIGVGAKACGGAQSYRAWSTTATDAQTLQERVDRYTTAHAAELRRSGVRSTCDITPVPAVFCKADPNGDGSGRCTLVKASDRPTR